MFETSCFDVWRQEKEGLKVMTLCKALDDHLGGGIATSLITELCGGPGSGKTQMCLQLCINVQFPKEVGGLGGKALYIDTNQDFHPARFAEIAQCMEKRFLHTFRNMYTQTGPQEPFNVNTLQDNCHYVYCANYLELMHTICTLRKILCDEPQLKLIVIDSFAFPLRDIEDPRKRTRIIYGILTDLQQLAAEFRVAVVITNELTTCVHGTNWDICPALGGSHAHKINHRIILSENREAVNFVAIEEKSVMLPKKAVPFVIKSSGIRGIR